MQEPGVVESQPTDHSTTQSDDSNTTGLAQDPRMSSAKGTPGRKRNQQEMEAEDRAATEIPTDEALHVHVKNTYTHPKSFATM